MDLFNNEKPYNLLPYEGCADYYGKILTSDKAQYYFEYLLKNILWQNDEAKLFGKHIITKRKAAWYGDSTYSYTYSNVTKQALPWSNPLLELKQIVETLSETHFNSCLLNLYHNGEEGVSWHSDDEKSLGRNTTIASLSLGAERIFSFKNKHTRQRISIQLQNGSLLVMKDNTQTHWLHSLPKSKKIHTPRINLTFRTILTS